MQVRGSDTAVFSKEEKISARKDAHMHEDVGLHQDIARRGAASESNAHFSSSTCKRLQTSVRLQEEGSEKEQIASSRHFLAQTLHYNAPGKGDTDRVL